MEQRADKIVARLEQIIDNGGDADALRAIEAWLSCVHGKPIERVEDVAPKSETAEALAKMTREERHAVLARMEQQGRLRLIRREKEAADH